MPATRIGFEAAVLAGFFCPDGAAGAGKPASRLLAAGLRRQVMIKLVSVPLGFCGAPLLPLVEEAPGVAAAAAGFTAEGGLAAAGRAGAGLFPMPCPLPVV